MGLALSYQLRLPCCFCRYALSPGNSDGHERQEEEHDNVAPDKPGSPCSCMLENAQQEKTDTTLSKKECDDTQCETGIAENDDHGQGLRIDVNDLAHGSEEHMRRIDGRCRDLGENGGQHCPVVPS